KAHDRVGPTGQDHRRTPGPRRHLEVDRHGDSFSAGGAAAAGGPGPGRLTASVAIAIAITAAAGTSAVSSAGPTVGRLVLGRPCGRRWRRRGGRWPRGARRWAGARRGRAAGRLRAAGRRRTGARRLGTAGRLRPARGPTGRLRRCRGLRWWVARLVDVRRRWELLDRHPLAGGLHVLGPGEGGVGATEEGAVPGPPVRVEVLVAAVPGNEEHRSRDLGGVADEPG